jgi:hypothetical protein
MQQVLQELCIFHWLIHVGFKERSGDTFTVFKHTPALVSVSGFIEQAR